MSPRSSILLQLLISHVFQCLTEKRAFFLTRLAPNSLLFASATFRVLFKAVKKVVIATKKCIYYVISLDFQIQDFLRCYHLYDLKLLLLSTKNVSTIGTDIILEF